ncbi:MAG: hypothetical protein U0798_07305 [Gemmataceae bacterium]
MIRSVFRTVVAALSCSGVLFVSAGSGWAQSPTATATGAGGGWRGEWVSETKGHHGPMRARVRPLDNGDYRVRYTGRFAGIIPFVYPATMHRVGEGATGEVFLTNTTRIPFFGTFHADAVLTDNTFDSQFTSRRESGRFTLRR